MTTNPPTARTTATAMAEALARVLTLPDEQAERLHLILRDAERRAGVRLIWDEP